jgi:hypothetical protein
MTKASDSAEPFGSELKAEGLVAGRQSLRKDPINIVYLSLVLRSYVLIFRMNPKTFNDT